MLRRSIEIKGTNYFSEVKYIIAILFIVPLEFMSIFSRSHWMALTSFIYVWQFSTIGVNLFPVFNFLVATVIIGIFSRLFLYLSGSAHRGPRLFILSRRIRLKKRVTKCQV